jgi:CRP-like cAMP-binding protein
MKRKSPWIAEMRNVALFSACTDKELETIASATTQLRFEAGTVMARQGHQGHEFMAIVEGRARVELEGDKVATLEAGEFFGEVSLLDGGPRTATVVAETDVLVEVIGEREFEAVLERSPHLARNLLRGLARKLRAADLQLVG